MLRAHLELEAEEVRAAWGWRAIERALEDLRYAARTLRRSPGFTTAAVLTLAIGISANSTMFSVVDGVLLKPLPYGRADRLVEVFARDAQGHRDYVSQPDLDDWRAMTRSFNGLASWVPQSVTLTGIEEPERVVGVFVSANFLPVLGVAPAMGRGIAPGEDGAPAGRGGERVAVLTDRLWRSRFGADAGVLGKVADLNGEPYTIIGVLPASFVFPQFDVDLLLPAFKYPNYSVDRGKASCAVLGRLRDGVSIERAQAEMDTVAARLAASFPGSDRTRGVTVAGFKEDVISGLKPSVVALAGAMGFVLLIGCANIAGLLIARIAGRQRERAVRIALGAGRIRLISHALAEASLLCGAGAGIGLLLSVWSVPAIGAAIAGYVPFGTTIELDPVVIAVTLGVSVMAALLVAAIPAFQCLQTEALRAGRGGPASAGKNRTRGILVAGEIALALVLLAGAGLTIESSFALARVRPGFNTRNLLTLAYRVPRNKYPSGRAQTEFHRAVVASIKTLPGVLAAASVRAVPFGGNGGSAEFLLTDRPEPAAAERPHALLNFADPCFFSTMEIPVLAGRVFNEHDEETSPYAIVIDRTLARRYFDGRNPIGQHLRIPSIDRTGEIIGVVGDIKQFTLADQEEPQIYGAVAQNPFIFTSLAVRTAGDPLQMVNAIRRAIRQIDKDQPVWMVRSFDEILAMQSRWRRLVTAALGAYAAVALLLASIGVFGVVSYTVRQRTAEIGIRMALGARPAGIGRLILRQGFSMAAAGIVCGTAVAMWLSRWLGSQLYAVSPLDPGVYAAAAALLLAIAMAASWIPARRAAKIDPATALRHE
jgi:putative ABC transport system permease protein